MRQTFEVFTAVLNKIQSVWNAALCRLVNSTLLSGGLRCLYLRNRGGLDLVDGGSALFRNVGNYSLADMV
jgi:hypothetical protein